MNLQTNDKTGPLLWSDCEDIEVYSDEQQLLYAGPRYLRCTRSECHELVTQGMVQKGGCWCGNRRLYVAFRLTTTEKAMLKRGYYPLLIWEASQIQPVCPEGKVPGWGQGEYLKRYA